MPILILLWIANAFQIHWTIWLFECNSSINFVVYQKFVIVNAIAIAIISIGVFQAHFIIDHVRMKNTANSSTRMNALDDTSHRSMAAIMPASQAHSPSTNSKIQCDSHDIYYGKTVDNRIVEQFPLKLFKQVVKYDLINFIKVINLSEHLIVSKT